jgi:hypothetical protein
LLTEMDEDWRPRGRKLRVSPERGFDRGKQRWAGIDTLVPLGELQTAGDPDHAGEEGLVLACIKLDKSQSPTVLVACSVLPWMDPGKPWPGFPARGRTKQLRHVLDHHVARIHREGDHGEALIWGGDFTQQLTRPFEGATVEGQAAPREAFVFFGLIALMERAEHLDPAKYSIDHLAVSPEFLAGKQVAGVHRPAWDGRGLRQSRCLYRHHHVVATPWLMGSARARSPSVAARSSRRRDR